MQGRGDTSLYVDGGTGRTTIAIDSIWHEARRCQNIRLHRATGSIPTPGR
ncbi:MAG: hypothetical protein ACRBCK_05545 [Alphaproteobacteria bacterium]